MILVDANLLLYALNEHAPENERSRAWLLEQIARGGGICLTWSVVLTVMRLLTNRHVFKTPLGLDAAVALIGGWLAHPRVTLLAPGNEHWRILSDLVRVGQVRGDMLPDAHLAAIAIEHGATLCSADRDFTRFDGLHLWNPLDRPEPPRKR